jgi:5-formyltetrahydrofolate cyclo-ligase
MPPALKKESDSLIFEKLKKHNDIINAENIMLYYSTSAEVDTHKIIDYLLSPTSEKKVWLPVIKGKKLCLRRLRNPAEIKKGKFGIPVPAENVPAENVSAENIILKKETDFIDPLKLDVVIVPGVSFTSAGDRLGRGGGYYDRFLSKLKGRVKIIGLCYRRQEASALPADKKDIKVDEIVSQ